MPEPTDPSAADDRETAPDDTESIPPGESVDLKAFIDESKPLSFETSGGANSEWPAAIRGMGEWPDGYADGDSLEVSIVVQDDQGTRTEATTSVTYDGGVYQYDVAVSATNNYAAGQVSTQS